VSRLRYTPSWACGQTNLALQAEHRCLVHVHPGGALSLSLSLSHTSCASGVHGTSDGGTPADRQNTAVSSTFIPAGLASGRPGPLPMYGTHGGGSASAPRRQIFATTDLKFQSNLIWDLIRPKATWFNNNTNLKIINLKINNNAYTVDLYPNPAAPLYLNSPVGENRWRQNLTCSRGGGGGQQHPPRALQTFRLKVNSGEFEIYRFFSRIRRYNYQ
jgi:hypothetical protein